MTDKTGRIEAGEFAACVDRVVDRAVLRECTPIPHLYGHEGREL